MKTAIPIDISDLFLMHYVEWRQKRIEKIVKIFGEQFFRGKSVLELGCGHGHIGKHFREALGADVTFAEARELNLNFVLQNNPGAEIILLDQEYDWSLGRKFDVIIHFGISYHLINWRQDLRCAMEHSELIIYETEVANSFDPKFVRRFEDIDMPDQAFNPACIGTRVSAAHIEAEVQRNGWHYQRYDDADLNCRGHQYDWAATGAADKIPLDEYHRDSEAGQRRFWVLRA